MPTLPMPMWRNRPAFTLLELLVVITLIALITSVVSVRMGSLAANARLQLAVDQIRFLDRQTRGYCERHGTTVKLVFSPNLSQIGRTSADDNKTIWPPLKLPTGIAVSRIERESHGTAREPIMISSLGRSESYAIRLTARQGRLVRWLVVAGVTGQPTILEQDDAAERALASW